MPPPTVAEFQDFFKLDQRLKSLPGLCNSLDLWRKSLDIDLPSSVRQSRFSTAVQGVFKAIAQAEEEGEDDEYETICKQTTQCLWADIQHMSDKPDAGRIRLALKHLLKLLAETISDSRAADADLAIEVFFIKLYSSVNDILTVENVPVIDKENVVNTYIHATNVPVINQTSHLNLLRLCRLEGYSVLFDLVSQRAITLYDLGYTSRARSTLLAYESALEMAVDSEEKFELDMRKGRKSKALGQWLDELKAKMLIQQGDKHFEVAMSGPSEQMMGRALLAQDDYRAAHKHVQESDWDIEGLALPRLARFYDKAAKMPLSAHKLYLNAVQLAVSQSSKTPNTEWYRTASAAVQAHRDKAEAEDAAKWENARRPILEQIKDKLVLIDSHSDDSTVEFVKFIWAEWPPKTSGTADLPADIAVPLAADAPADAKPKISKKALILVIARYHPDKHQEAWGNEWKALSEEICKHLNRRHENVKMGDVDTAK